MSDIDFSADLEATTANTLGDLQKIAVALKLKQDLVSKMEQELKDGKAELRRWEFEVVPQAMMSAKVKSFAMDDNTTVKLTDYLEAGLPTLSAIAEADEERRIELLARRAGGLTWLRENEGAPIIKNVLTIEVPKGKDNEVSRLIEMAEECGLMWERGESVHGGTLKKFLKEKLQNGTIVPVDLFGIFQGLRAKLFGAKKGKDLI